MVEVKSSLARMSSFWGDDIFRVFEGCFGPNVSVAESRSQSTKFVEHSCVFSLLYDFIRRCSVGYTGNTCRSCFCVLMTMRVPSENVNQGSRGGPV